MRVLIADPSKRFRQSLRKLLEADGSEVVAEVESGREMNGHVARYRPDAVLITVAMPEEAGVETTRNLLAALQHAKVVVLTAAAGEIDVASALELGVESYLLKALESDRFFDLPRRLAHGEPGQPLELSGKPARIACGDGSPSRELLTRREQQVLALMARGITSNRHLARRLRVSENTVKFHVRNILDKLHLHDRTQAVGYALRAKAQRDSESGGEDAGRPRNAGDRLRPRAAGSDWR